MSILYYITLEPRPNELNLMDGLGESRNQYFQYYYLSLIESKNLDFIYLLFGFFFFFSQIVNFFCQNLRIEMELPIYNCLLGQFINEKKNLCKYNSKNCILLVLNRLYLNFQINTMNF
jgi:hypothetical protein